MGAGATVFLAERLAVKKRVLARNGSVEHNPEKAALTARAKRRSRRIKSREKRRGEGGRTKGLAKAHGFFRAKSGVRTKSGLQSPHGEATGYTRCKEPLLVPKRRDGSLSVTERRRTDSTKARASNKVGARKVVLPPLHKPRAVPPKQKKLKRRLQVVRRT